MSRCLVSSGSRKRKFNALPTLESEFFRSLRKKGVCVCPYLLLRSINIRTLLFPFPFSLFPFFSPHISRFFMSRGTHEWSERRRRKKRTGETEILNVTINLNLTSFFFFLHREQSWAHTRRKKNEVMRFRFLGWEPILANSAPSVQKRAPLMVEV